MKHSNRETQPHVNSLLSDSFNSFREILDIALERRVDFVLLGGDLFHDNKPTRNSERQCIEILREKVRSCTRSTF